MDIREQSHLEYLSLIESSTIDALEEHTFKQRIIESAKVILKTTQISLMVLSVVVGLAGMYVWLQMSKFDDKALAMYADMAKQFLVNDNPADAMVWRVPVKPGVDLEIMESIMDSVAGEHNLKRVGESVLFDDRDKAAVEDLTGVPYRYAKTLMYCNAVTAARMLDYNKAFSAYIPCRITLIEDAQGKYWLYSLNIDMMIYGGKALPAELKADAVAVRNGLLDIMHRAASGDF